MARFVKTLLLSALISACGSAGLHGQGTTPSVPVPAKVTDETYAEAVRSVHALSLDDPARTVVRERIVAYLAERTEAEASGGDYDAIVEHFKRFTSLYSSEDFDKNRLTEAIEPAAKKLLALASPRGDEARAMSALLVLRTLYPTDASYEADYNQVAGWGRDSRKYIPNPLDRTTQLIGIWEEHAMLTPSPEVLGAAARLHVERRNAVARMMRHGDSGHMLLPMRLQRQVVQRAPFDVAAIYLSQGNVAAALSRIEAMGDASVELVAVLREALEPPGLDALHELADFFLKERPEVALGICRLGLRRNPEDPRFPTCLARLGVLDESSLDATAWYRRAIELAPANRSLYDEALEALDAFIRADSFDSHGEAQRVAESAERVLRERLERWPDADAPIPPEELYLRLARLELNAGNVRGAKKRLESSLAAKNTADALEEMGLLALRQRHPDKATRIFERALEMVEGNALGEALLLEHLGDAAHEQGDSEEAKSRYERALAIWDSIAAQRPERSSGAVEQRRGILLDWLGKHGEAATAFRNAMAAAPQDRQTYAGILSHLVVAQPDPDLAEEVFRRAQRQLTLDPQWKVYFALWVLAIHGRAGVPVSEELMSLLEGLSSSPSWWGVLARFGAGKIPYDELLAEAGNVGERTEAHFYEATRRLAQGDDTGARELFERVLSMDMVKFYEFAMSQELLREAP